VNKVARNLILAAAMLAGFAANSYAGLIAAPVPVPVGTPR
jgi:hypothetical protein